MYYYYIHRYDQKSKDYVLPLSDIWEMRPGGATRYRYLHNTLTLQVPTLSKPLFFIDITVYMHICETTHYRSR